MYKSSHLCFSTTNYNYSKATLIKINYYDTISITVDWRIGFFSQGYNYLTLVSDYTFTYTKQTFCVRLEKDNIKLL